MKKKLFLLTLWAVAVTACASEKATTITGRLEGLPEGTTVSLIPGATHMNEEAVSEATVTNGEFILKPVIEEPRVFYLRADGVRGGSTIMVAPGEQVTVTGTLSTPVVGGSKVYEEFVEKYANPRGALDKIYNDNQKKYADVSRRMGEARNSNDPEAVAKVRESEEWKSLEKAESDLFRQLDEMLDKAVKDNADSYWGPLILMLNTAYLTPESERHYDMFSDAAKNSFYGKAVAAEIFGITGPAPAFTAMDAMGKEHDLNGLLDGNKYVLIDFWASWCGPCRRFVPTLKELAAKYADKGLVVVSISTDTDREAWLKALEEEQMPWLNLIDESAISKAYGVSGIPSIFLVDPKGELVFGKQNGQSVVDKLAKVFDNK